MFSQASLAIGTNLAEITVNSGIQLVPKQSALIEELTLAVKNNIFSNIEKREHIEPSLLLAASGVDKIEGNTKTYIQSNHDIIMDNYEADLSKIVENHISFARNIVNKQINLFREKIQEGISSYKFKEAEDFFSVTYFKPAEVFFSYLIDNEINPYRDSTSKFFLERLNLTKLDVEEFDLGSYILTGDEEQDTYISVWFNSKGKDSLMRYLLEDIPEYALSVPDLLDYSLINYLFYRNLLNRTDLNLGYSVIQLKNKCSLNRDYYGKKLSTALEIYKRDIETGRLLTTDSEVAFSYFNDKPLAIRIYEESFAKLAEAGCSIEVLFGFISNENRNDVTVSELIEKKEYYLNKWNTVRSLYIISMNKSKLDTFKRILINKFDESLQDLTEAEVEVSNGSFSFIQETRDLGYKYIDSLELSDIENIDRICLELVAKIRFRFSNAYFILNEMNEILKMSEDITPMEAALYASIKYVTDFFLEQIEVVRI